MIENGAMRRTAGNEFAMNPALGSFNLYKESGHMHPEMREAGMGGGRL